MEKENGFEESPEDLVAGKLSEILGLQRRVSHNLAEIQDVREERGRLIEEFRQMQTGLSEASKADFLGSGRSLQEWTAEMEQDWKEVLSGKRVYEKIDVEQEKKDLA